MTEGNFDDTAGASSRALAAEIRRVAAAKEVDFLDAATVARAGEDGLHLTPDSHRPLAELIAAWLQAG